MEAVTVSFPLLVFPWVIQLISGWVSQSTGLVGHSVTQLDSQSVSQSVSHSFQKSVSCSFSFLVGQLDSQSIRQSINKTVNQLDNQSVIHSGSYSVNQSALIKPCWYISYNCQGICKLFGYTILKMHKVRNDFHSSSRCWYLWNSFPSQPLMCSKLCCCFQWHETPYTCNRKYQARWWTYNKLHRTALPKLPEEGRLKKSLFIWLSLFEV